MSEPPHPVLLPSGEKERSFAALELFAAPQALRRSPDLPGLPAEHGALAGDAPVIAGEIARLADDAMARHHERHRVLADGGADGACGGRLVDLAGNVRIGSEARSEERRVGKE